MDEGGKNDTLQRKVQMFSFRRAAGLPYKKALADIHSALDPKWYLEIGTEKGESAVLSNANTICVDPKLRISQDIVGQKPSLHVFQMTSDDFFDHGHADVFVGKVDFAFLDGMHIFEYLLRDFMNTERLAASNAVIAMHDIVPMSAAAADRIWDRRLTGDWTGDVWKVIFILRKYRPDLSVRVFDFHPSGLALVENLDPTNKILEENYQKICAEMMEVSPEGLGETAFYSEMKVLHTGGWQFTRIGDLAEATPSSPVVIPNSSCDLAIKIPPASPEVQKNWGEYHFGKSLAKELTKRGAKVRMDCANEWYANRRSGEPELVIRGPKPFEPSDTNPCLYWILFHSASLRRSELEKSSHISVASEAYRMKLDGLGLDKPTSTLLHCTDPDLFAPRLPTPACASELLFVGVQHPERKNGGMARLAVEAGLPVTVWGPNWEELPIGVLKGRHIPNDRLSEYYSSAAAVLNDHMIEMRAHGFMNNRLFDALACGAPVISDHSEGIPEEFRDYIFTVKNVLEISEAYQTIKNEDRVMRDRRARFARWIREEHTFERRASRIESIINSIAV